MSMNQQHSLTHTHTDSIFFLPAPPSLPSKMFPPSHLKSLYPLQLKSSSSSSSPSPSSNIASMKFKRIIHTLIVSHLCRIIRALSKVKDVIVDILKDNSSAIHFPYPSQKKRNNNMRKKIILGSFRLHYNWCSSKSSHVLPVPEGLFDSSSTTHLCHEDCPDSNLAGYLRWLEEKKIQGGDSNKEEGEDIVKENIDMLAEMFIANCHEKFKLEKQESDRRFQEMLARSM